eukprot:9747446-Karenia_brevis.AAC.1
MLEYFGMDGSSKAGVSNGSKEERPDDNVDELLGKEEAKVFRSLAATLNFVSLDCPDLQFSIKQ